MNRGPGIEPVNQPIDLRLEKMPRSIEKEDSSLLALSNDRRIQLNLMLPNGQRTQAMLLREENSSEPLSLLIDAPACQGEEVVKHLIKRGNATKDLQHDPVKNLAKTATLRFATERDDREETRALYFFPDSKNDEIVRVQFPEELADKFIEQTLNNVIESGVLIVEAQKDEQLAFSHRKQLLESQERETATAFREQTSKAREEIFHRNHQRDAEKMDELIREIAETLLEEAASPSYLDEDSYKQEKTIFETLKQNILTSPCIIEDAGSERHASQGSQTEHNPDHSQSNEVAEKEIILVWDNESGSSIETKSLSLNDKEVSFSHEHIRPALLALQRFFDQSESIRLIQTAWESTPRTDTANTPASILRELNTRTKEGTKEDGVELQSLPNRRDTSQRQDIATIQSRSAELHSQLSKYYDHVIIVSSADFGKADRKESPTQEPEKPTSSQDYHERSSNIIQYVPRPAPLFDQLKRQLLELELSEDNSFLF